MTRTQVNRKLRQVYFAISLVLLISLVAALAPFIPGIPKVLSDMSGKVYELMRDMSLLIATLAAAYLANVFQKRSTFVAALEREWRGIVSTKSTLYSYCERTDPSDSEYLTAYCRISDTIDNMRIVYKNAGETDRLIGLYPYAPLHDMRRALQSIDPRRTSHLSDADRRLVQDAEQGTQPGRELAAVDDRVDVAVLELPLGEPEVRRELLAGGLFDDAGSAERDEGAGFGVGDVAQRGERRPDTARGGVGEHHDERKARIVEFVE